MLVPVRLLAGVNYLLVALENLAIASGAQIMFSTNNFSLTNKFIHSCFCIFAYYAKKVALANLAIALWTCCTSVRLSGTDQFEPILEMVQ